MGPDAPVYLWWSRLAGVEGLSAIAYRPGAPALSLVLEGTLGLSVVQATAALDSGKFTPDSTFYDPGYCEEYGQRVNNYDTSSPFGTVTLVQAMQNSINSVFCNIGKQLGAGTILRYADRFGFYSLPPLETPENERVESGLYSRGRLFIPKQPQFQVDPGRLAFGQERLQVTPLQMALVAATVANGGELLRPRRTALLALHAAGSEVSDKGQFGENRVEADPPWVNGETDASVPMGRRLD